MYIEGESIEKILKNFQSRAVIIDIRAFDNVPTANNHLKTLGENFLNDKLVQKLVKCYGERNLQCSSRGLQLILRFIHHKAFAICIQYLKANKFIPDFFSI